MQTSCAKENRFPVYMRLVAPQPGSLGTERLAISLATVCSVRSVSATSRVKRSVMDEGGK
jgi:hypothetical protein